MRHTYRISRPEQIAALASPARVEILDILASLGVSSVAAIAAALGRPADALYYHLRFLVRVGLVRQVGKGRGRRREQALYKTVAPRLSVARPRRSRQHGGDDAHGGGTSAAGRPGFSCRVRSGHRGVRAAARVVDRTRCRAPLGRGRRAGQSPAQGHERRPRSLAPPIEGTALCSDLSAGAARTAPKEEETMKPRRVRIGLAALLLCSAALVRAALLNGEEPST